MAKTIEQAVKAYLIKEKSKLKQSTFSRYSFICERHIIPYFQGIQLDQINNQTINDFIQYKLRRGGLRETSLSPKTVNDMVCLLTQIIKKHIQLDLDIEKPQYRQEEITVLADPELNSLKSYLTIGTDSKKLGIFIAMLTGIRIGELCALKWENVDLEQGTIFINETMQRVKMTDNSSKRKTKIIIDTPKSPASIRRLPIPEILVATLRRFKADNDFFVLTNTKKYIEPRVYQRQFKSYLEACSIRDYNFHVLRHTFATMAIAKGVDIKTLSVLLGHTDVSFTMKRYVHPNMEHKRLQIEKLAVGF